MLVDATLYVFGRCVISTYSTHVVHSTITNIQIAGKPSRRNHSTNDGIVKHRFVFDIGTTKSNKKIEKYEKCTNNA